MHTGGTTALVVGQALYSWPNVTGNVPFLIQVLLAYFNNVIA